MWIADLRTCVEMKGEKIVCVEAGLFALTVGMSKPKSIGKMSNQLMRPVQFRREILDEAKSKNEAVM